MEHNFSTLLKLLRSFTSIRGTVVQMYKYRCYYSGLYGHLPLLVEPLYTKLFITFLQLVAASSNFSICSYFLLEVLKKTINIHMKTNKQALYINFFFRIILNRYIRVAKNKVNTYIR